MADSNLLKFFLNTGEENSEASVVKAPAFSLTKVMIVVAPLITALGTFVSDRLAGTTFSATNITTIAVALVAFLAITGAADVIARGVAAAAQSRADATIAGQTAKSGIVSFSAPIAATLSLAGPDEAIHVVAISDSQPPKYLCVRKDSSVTWESSGEVQVG